MSKETNGPRASWLAPEPKTILTKPNQTVKMVRASRPQKLGQVNDKSYSMTLVIFMIDMLVCNGLSYTYL